MPKDIRNELHHWWPRSLSQFWADQNGIAHCIQANGDLVPSKPKAFGAIRNDNAIKLADVPTVWDESFEHTFNRPDSQFPELINWLQNQVPSRGGSGGGFASRLAPIAVNEEEHIRLTECLASLIARSPSFRYRVANYTEHLRKEFGIETPPEKHLIGLNVRNAQLTLSSAMDRGLFAILYSGEEEFIFGDGFLHNISSVSVPPLSLFPRCLIPLTPEIAIFYTKPIRYGRWPCGFSLNLTRDEVGFVNDAVQIYSKRFLFFREIHPILQEEFLMDEHRQFKHDRHDWTDRLEDTIAAA